MKSLDEEVRDALVALENSVPQDYFDGFPARVEARLEVEAMAPDKPSPDPEKPGAEVQTENTGLHDIKEMARTQKQRISRRISTQSDVEESLLSTSSSGLKAVVLPTPGQDTPRYETEDPVPAEQEESRGGGVPIWIYAAVGVVAVAAVVFLMVRGGGKNKDEQTVASGDVSASEPGPVVAAIEPTPGPDQAPAAAPESPEEAVPEPGEADRDGAGGVVGGLASTPGGAVGTGGGAEGAASGDDRGAAAAKEPSTRHKAADKPARASRPAKSSDTKKPTETKKSTETKTSPPPPDKTKPTSEAASLEEMLTEASGGVVEPKEAKKPVAKKPSKTELTSGDIRKGMRSVLARVQTCYSEHKQSGTVKVSVTVAPDGHVEKASAIGQFAGGAYAQTGSCVAKAVENAKFPAWDGGPMTFKYSYLLSE